MSDLRGLLHRYLEWASVERGLRPNSLAAYHSDLRSYLDFLACRGVRGLPIPPEAPQLFLSWRAAAGCAPSSLARAVSAIRGFHAFLVREGLAREDPAREARGPRVPRSLPRPLAIEEVDALVASASRGDPLALRDRAILEVMYGSGLRVSEVVSLDLDQLDLESGFLRVKGKGGKEREIPLGRPGLDALRCYLDLGRPALARGRQTPAVFLNARGRRITRQGCWLVVKRSARLALPEKRVTPHMLRHSFATHLLAGGADLRSVQELLGHARARTTQVYTLVTRERILQEYFASHPRARKPKRPRSVLISAGQWEEVRGGEEHG